MTDLNRKCNCKCNSPVNNDFDPTAKFLVEDYLSTTITISIHSSGNSRRDFLISLWKLIRAQGLQRSATISDDWGIDFSGPPFNLDRTFYYRYLSKYWNWIFASKHSVSNNVVKFKVLILERQSAIEERQLNYMHVFFLTLQWASRSTLRSS